MAEDANAYVSPRSANKQPTTKGWTEPSRIPRTSSGIVFLAAIALWVVACFVPAVEFQIVFPGEPNVLPGADCLRFLFWPGLWLLYWFCLGPLLFVNVGTALAFLAQVRRRPRRVPLWIIVWNLLGLPLAFVTLALVTRLRIGFYLWITSLVLFSLSLILQRRAVGQRPESASHLD